MVDGARGRASTHEKAHDAAPDHVNVITAAQPSYDEQFRSRRRRYLIMMAMRVPCLVLAVVFYQTPWLAISIILISIPLPWCAVLIANDGPARKQRRPVRHPVNDQRAVPGPGADVIDQAPPQADQAPPQADDAPSPR